VGERSAAARPARSAIAALPEALRVCYVLRAVEGYAHAEVAELLGISIGASEVRVHRAVRALRISLAHLR
jgi:RNA polymerase sigma-70 factor (ECF subfamily)